MKKNPKSKCLVFYSRQEQANSFRTVFVNFLNTKEKHSNYDYEDVFIFCGKGTYPGAKHSGVIARKKFEQSVSNNFLDRVLLISILQEGAKILDSVVYLFF